MQEVRCVNVAFCIFSFSLSLSLHIYKDHKAPPESSHQEHGDVHAVDEDLVQDAKVQPAMSQQQQDDWKFVLETQEDASAHVLDAQQCREHQPQQRREQAAAEVEEEAHEAVGQARLQVQVEVAVVCAQQLGGARRDAGRVHARAVGAVEGARPPRDGDHGHEWASGLGRRLVGPWHGCEMGHGVRFDGLSAGTGRTVDALMSAL